jgi:hypothetical protein
MRSAVKAASSRFLAPLASQYPCQRESAPPLRARRFGVPQQQTSGPPPVVTYEKGEAPKSEGQTTDKSPLEFSIPGYEGPVIALGGIRLVVSNPGSDSASLSSFIALIRPLCTPFGTDGRERAVLMASAHYSDGTSKPFIVRAFGRRRTIMRTNAPSRSR